MRRMIFSGNGPGSCIAAFFLEPSQNGKSMIEATIFRNNAMKRGGSSATPILETVKALPQISTTIRMLITAMLFLLPLMYW